MKRAYERLLEYVKFDTASDANSPTVPSTMKQKDLGEYLVKEMKGRVGQRYYYRFPL